MDYLSLTIPTYGAIRPPNTIPTGGLNPTGEKIISLGLTVFFIAGILIALIFLIYAGIQWIMSGGDKQKLQSARTQVIYSILGLVVIFVAILITQFIGALFNISFIK